MSWGKEALQVIRAFGGQLEQNGESMSALVQAAARLVRDRGAIEVDAKPQAVRRPDSVEEIASRAVVMRTVEWMSPAVVRLDVRIERGWHVQASDATNDFVATRLNIETDLPFTVNYPSAIERQLEFADTALRVFEGEISLTVNFVSPPRGALRATLTYQACDDRACLPPTTKRFVIPAR